MRAFVRWRPFIRASTLRAVERFASDTTHHRDWLAERQSVVEPIQEFGKHHNDGIQRCPTEIVGLTVNTYGKLLSVEKPLVAAFDLDQERFGTTPLYWSGRASSAGPFEMISR